MTCAEVVKLMESSNNTKEWNQNADKVKAAFGGNYPDFWFMAIVVSGIAAKKIAEFDFSEVND